MGKSNPEVLLVLIITMVIVGIIMDVGSVEGEKVNYDIKGLMGMNKTITSIENKNNDDKTLIEQQKSKLQTEMEIYRNETYNYTYFYPSQGNGTNNKLEVEYYLNHIAGTLEEVVLNSTSNYLLIEEEKDTSYVSINYYQEVPIFTELKSEVQEEGRELTIRIALGNAPVKLGRYKLEIRIKDIETNEVINLEESFILKSEIIYKEIINYLNTSQGYRELKTIGGVISPGDTVIQVGEIKDGMTNKTVTKDDGYISEMITRTSMGGEEIIQNTTLAKNMTGLVEQLGVEIGNNSVVEVIKIPAMDFIGNITVERSVKIGIDQALNSSWIETYELITNKTQIECDYEVRVEALGGNIEGTMWLGDIVEQRFKVTTLKVYDPSKETEEQFMVEDVKIKNYRENESMTLIEGMLKIREEGNILKVYSLCLGEYEKGGEILLYGQGNYSYELYLNDKKVYSSLEYRLMEDYGIELWEYETVPAENITIEDKEEPLYFAVTLVYRNSRQPAERVEGLKYWIGINEIQKSEVKDKTNAKRWVELEVQFEGNKTELYVWVEFTNGTIIKIYERIEVYYKPRPTSVNNKTSRRLVIDMGEMTKLVLGLGVMVVPIIAGVKVLKKIE